MSKKPWWRFDRIIRKLEDRKGAHANTIVVILLGPSGSGRSSFINAAIGEHRLACEGDAQSKPDSQLEPVTKEVTDVRYLELATNREFMFIDTPGLDLGETDSTLIDLQAKTAKLSKHVDALIYLHRVNNPRVTTPPECYAKIFQLLGGSGWEKRSMLATTMWAQTKHDVGEKRETELREKFWKTPTEQGARMDRFDETRDDAWRLLNQLITPA